MVGVILDWLLWKPLLRPSGANVYLESYQKFVLKNQNIKCYQNNYNVVSFSHQLQEFE